MSEKATAPAAWARRQHVPTGAPRPCVCARTVPGMREPTLYALVRCRRCRAPRWLFPVTPRHTHPLIPRSHAPCPVGSPPRVCVSNSRHRPPRLQKRNNKHCSHAQARPRQLHGGAIPLRLVSRDWTIVLSPAFQQLQILRAPRPAPDVSTHRAARRCDSPPQRVRVRVQGRDAAAAEQHDSGVPADTPDAAGDESAAVSAAQLVNQVSHRPVTQPGSESSGSDAGRRVTMSEQAATRSPSHAMSMGLHTEIVSMGRHTERKSAAVGRLLPTASVVWLVRAAHMCVALLPRFPAPHIPQFLNRHPLHRPVSACNLQANTVTYRPTLYSHCKSFTV